MNNDVPFQSVLKIDKLLVREMGFRRSDEWEGTAPVRYHFEKHISYSAEKDKSRVSLSVDAAAEDDVMSLRVELVGFFSVSLDVVDDAMVKQLLEINATAIMFPYLRSQVSLITTQPGLNPVIIPPININALFEAQDSTSEK